MRLDFTCGTSVRILLPSAVFCWTESTPWKGIVPIAKECFVWIAAVFQQALDSFDHLLSQVI